MASLTRPSAFRAVKTFGQDVFAQFQQVTYETQEFDLQNEYDPSNSTFIPKKGGVYTITASAAFYPNAPFGKPLTATMLIRINGMDIARQDHYFLPTQAGPHAVEVSTIIQLSAGDAVQVWTVITGGAMTIFGNAGTNFGAARFPSP